MSDLRLNAANVEIELGGQKFLLVPNIKAMQAISRQYSGLGNARTRLVQEDVDAMANVIAAGANMSPRDAQKVPDLLYTNGVTADLMVELIRYVAILGNGGKPVDIQGDPMKVGDEGGNQ